MANCCPMLETMEEFTWVEGFVWIFDMWVPTLMDEKRHKRYICRMYQEITVDGPPVGRSGNDKLIPAGRDEIISVYFPREALRRFFDQTPWSEEYQKKLPWWICSMHAEGENEKPNIVESVLNT